MAFAIFTEMSIRFIKLMTTHTVSLMLVEASASPHVFFRCYGLKVLWIAASSGRTTVCRNMVYLVSVRNRTDDELIHNSMNLKVLLADSDSRIFRTRSAGKQPASAHRVDLDTRLQTSNERL